MFKRANYSKKEINQPRKPKIKKIENETSREREREMSQGQNVCSHTGILFGGFQSTLTRRS